jgi:glucokinase
VEFTYPPRRLPNFAVSRPKYIVSTIFGSLRKPFKARQVTEEPDITRLDRIINILLTVPSRPWYLSGLEEGMYLAAVDIGGTKVSASVSDRNGIIAKVKEPTCKEGDDAALPRQVIALVAAACADAGVRVDDIEAVGVSTCSPFKKRDGKLGLIAPNICGGLGWSPVPLPNDWVTIPLEAELAKAFGNVSIGNDCVTAAVAERTFGAGRGVDDLVYITWSTGIGAGAFVDGHLISGKNSNAMHLGHIPLHLDGEESYRDGWRESTNLEPHTAGPAIARLYDGSTDTLGVFKRYREGDDKARAVIGRAAKLFARALVTVTMLLDTKLFIFGGSVSKDWDVLEPLVADEFYAANPFFVGEVEFKRCALEDYLGDLAGLSLVMPEDWITDWLERKPWERS